MEFRQILYLAANQAGRASASPSYAAWPSLIGAEMMTNGDCSSGTGWTLGSGYAIAAGKMTLTATSATTENAGVVNTAFVEGATYRNVFTIDTASLGSVQLFVGDTGGTSRSTAGTFSQDLVAVNTAAGDGWYIDATSATMQLDNFSVKSVGLMGVEADWTFTGGDVAWLDLYQSFVFSASLAGGSKAALTGSAKTAFDASVTTNTACSVTITSDATDSNLNGPFAIALRGGTPVTFTFSGAPGEQITHTVTSGAGSGFEMTASVDVSSGAPARIQIALV